MSSSNNSLDITELVCVICLESYSETKIALILACGHSFCSECLLQLHRNSTIKCPEDRIETYVDSVDHLIRNISLMRMVYDDEACQLLSQQTTLIANIKRLRSNVTHLIEKKRKSIETSMQRIALHMSTLEGFYNLSSSLFNKISLANHFTVDSYELKQLYDVTSQMSEDYECFDELKKTLLNCLLVLDELEKTSQVCIILNELMETVNEINQVYERDLKVEQINKIDKQLNESIKIYNFLKGFEEKYFHGIFDLQSKNNVKLNDIINGLEYDLKFAKFRIGIIGNSGKGKSSFINRARGLNDPKPTDTTIRLRNELDECDLAAPTGVGETTKFPLTYSWKEKSTILLKDFPGFGLCKEPVVENYINKYLLKDNSHIYVILYTERLTSSEIELARIITTKLKKTAILARSKTDRDIADLSDNNNEKTGAELFKELKLRLNYEINQQEFDAYFDQSFERKNLKVFLISCKKGLETKYEMNNFLQEIFKCLPNELSDDENCSCSGMTSNLFLNLSKREVNKIKEKLEDRILGLSFLSAATDALPIAGQIADLSILIGECTRYRNYFCLRKDYINELAMKYNISEDKIASILKIVAFDAKYLNLKDFVLGLISAVSIGISVFQAVTSAVSLGINIATFGAGCLISAAITGPFSFYLCKNVLKKALEQMAEDALKIIEEIHKEIIEKNMA